FAAVEPSLPLVATAENFGRVSFSPDAYRLYISTIVLMNDSGLSNQFYMCDSTEADCEVDFANAESIAAFEAKLSGISISEGDYTKVWMSCSPKDDGYIKYSGQVKFLDGTTYYTADNSNGGAPITTDSSKKALMKISGLQGSCGITMPVSVNVSEEKPVTITMFSNLRLTTYFAKKASNGQGGCAAVIDPATNNGPGFCANYPSVFPYFGETKPTVEYYKVANSKQDASALTDADSIGLIKIIKDEGGTPFWASAINIFNEATIEYEGGEDAVAGYAASVSKFAVNSDGTLLIQTDRWDTDMPRGFKAFQRAAHTGEVVGEKIVDGAGTGTSTTYKYKAFPYEP
ncbi:MAG: hypothetical protein NTX25_23010, partial [Proteobacteria bacterium]|nr:hypothetical protein [Pseudomonadota bacterium]